MADARRRASARRACPRAPRRERGDDPIAASASATRRSVHRDRVAAAPSSHTATEPRRCRRGSAAAAAVAALAISRRPRGGRRRRTATSRCSAPARVGCRWRTRCAASSGPPRRREPDRGQRRRIIARRAGQIARDLAARRRLDVGAQAHPRRPRGGPRGIPDVRRPHVVPGSQTAVVPAARPGPRRRAGPRGPRTARSSRRRAGERSHRAHPRPHRPRAAAHGVPDLLRARQRADRGGDLRGRLAHRLARRRHGAADEPGHQARHAAGPGGGQAARGRRAGVAGARGPRRRLGRGGDHHRELPASPVSAGWRCRWGCCPRLDLGKWKTGSASRSPC